MKTEATHRRFEIRNYVIAALIFSFGASVSGSAALAKSASLNASVFEKSRSLISLKNSKAKSLKGISESTIIEYLQANPEYLKHDLTQLVRELNQQPKVIDPTKHVRLIPPEGQPGYEDLRIFVSHPYRIGDKEMPADNLVKALIDSIRLAQKEIALNVYEFDLDPLATELIRAHKDRKIAVRIGVDAKPLRDQKNPKPRQIAIVDRLRSAGIEVTEVNSAKINHQKMIAIDWSDPKLARAVFSSGNFTRSCLDPRGDLVDLPESEMPELARAYSIPNANHIITMKSWLAANLIQHEITKVVSRDLHLRGKSFPTSGAYQITGPGVDPETFEAYPENSFVIAFTPGGGNRDVNKNILAHLLRKSEGPIRMTQFAFSSLDISSALLERAERDIQKTGKFDFIAVGDTPFAMQKWSQFLKMSGYTRTSTRKGKTKTTNFKEDALSPWKKSLGADAFAAIRKNIRVAPPLYKTHLKLAGRQVEVSAKIHHKILSMGNFAVVGTSFNFSEGAEGNNEQVLVFNDPRMAAVVRGITEELANQSPRSVAEEATWRNELAERRLNKAKKKNLGVAKIARTGLSVDTDDLSLDEELPLTRAVP